MILPRPKTSHVHDPRLRKIPQDAVGTNAQEQMPFYLTIWTLTLNDWGLKSVLWSASFNSCIPCNLVTPWLQPISEILYPLVAKGELRTLASIMSKRQPHLAALWLGVVIIGLGKSTVRRLRIAPNIRSESAAWTKTNAFFHAASHPHEIYFRDRRDRPF